MSNGLPLNCAEEICCLHAEAVAALAASMERAGCRTPQEYAEFVLKHWTLAPPEFRAVKAHIAKLAREN